MNITQFVNIGFYNGVNISKVILTIPATTSQGKRIRKKAQDEGRYIDCTGTKRLQSLILYEGGTVVGTMFKPSTILERINKTNNPENVYSSFGVIENTIEEEQPKRRKKENNV